MPIKAVIFDMDGTLVDSEKLHMLAYMEILKRRGHYLDEKKISRYLGKPSRDVIRLIFNELGLKAHEDELMQFNEEKNKYYRQIASEELQQFAGAPSILLNLKSAGYMTALGTSGTLENVNFVMGKFGFHDYFDAFACIVDVQHGKPSPDIFLKAAEKLGVEPKDCVVIEDTKNGILAARNAGMKVIAVATTFHKDELSDADLVVKDISMISPEMIRSLEE